MSRLYSLLIAPCVWLAACGNQELPPAPAGVGTDWADDPSLGCEDSPDEDDDGWCAEADCDDADPDTNPGVVESCDGLDNDCDGRIDEGAIAVWYADLDEDGYGDPSSAVSACSAPALHVTDGQDCDDARGDVHPGAKEVCGDGVDNDCADGDAPC